jgi:oligopeptide transport system substrate-binding protein
MYLEGEIDWIPGLGESAAWPEPGSETNPAPAEYHLTPGLATYYYVIQNQRKPFDDPRVRKALSMAIDRSALVEAVSRQGEYTTGDEVTGQGEYTTGDEAPMQGEVTAGGFVPPMAGYPGIQGNRCDGFKARRLLAEAGYPGGAGFPVFELLYNTSEYHRTVAEFVRRQWAQTLGIECELVNKEWKSYLAARRAGEFDIARAGWRGDYRDPNAFLEIFATFASLNDARYSSRDYERLMRKAATMRPGQERMAALEKAEEILITRDQAVIPLYYYVHRNLIDTSTWGGWYENVMDSHPLKYIHKR